MRFLLDMGLAQRTAEYLRGHGYDAVHLRAQGLQRLSDESIVAKALVEGCVILAHDTDMRAQEVNRRLEDVLSRFAAQLAEGALISVTDDAVRIRRLPVGRS